MCSTSPAPPFESGEGEPLRQPSASAASADQGQRTPRPVPRGRAPRSAAPSITTLRATSPAFIFSKASLISSSGQARRDHLVELQPAVEVEVDVARHVDAEAIRAHHRADDASCPGARCRGPAARRSCRTARRRPARSVPPLRIMASACADGGLACRCTRTRSRRRRRGSASTRERRVALRGVDAVRRAELAREIELPRHGVDRDDAARAGDAAALDRREADAAAADHDRRVAGPDARGVERRAEAGRDAAADQRRAVERHVGADLHQRVLVHEHALGEGREVRELVQVGSPSFESRGVASGGRAVASPPQRFGRPERQ